jgi:hypothetical protein
MSDFLYPKKKNLAKNDPSGCFPVNSGANANLAKTKGSSALSLA